MLKESDLVLFKLKAFRLDKAVEYLKGRITSEELQTVYEILTGTDKAIE
jgi:hypothetical protein